MVTFMKAAVLEQINKPLQILDKIKIPSIGYGQVLVELAYSGICHSQLMEISGGRGFDKYLPHLLGHEGSGRVVSVGEGVSKVVPGDLVILGWIKGIGLEGGAIKYNHGANIINAGSITTFNHFAVVSENRIFPLPDGIPLDIAVLFGCALPTGAGIVMNEIMPKKGTVAAVFGLGGVGISSLIAFNLFDCQKIIAIDISTSKLELAKEFGATDIIKVDNNINLLNEIRSLTSNQNGVDYAVDASGNVNSIETAFQSVRNNGGQCIFASHPKNGELISINPYDLICGKILKGSWGGGCNPDTDIPRLAKLFTEGKLPLHKLIQKTYSLDDINIAFSDLKNGLVTRPLIVLNKNI